jgi:hypothetical protein
VSDFIKASISKAAFFLFSLLRSPRLRWTIGGRGEASDPWCGC